MWKTPYSLVCELTGLYSQAAYFVIKTDFMGKAICKVLCPNICCLIQNMYELNLSRSFGVWLLSCSLAY
jgi:hypothetical protein